MEYKNKDMYNIGDFVIIKQANTENKTLGKIEEIYDENGELLFKFNEYYFPEKTQGKYFNKNFLRKKKNFYHAIKGLKPLKIKAKRLIC